jgi:hypothetical protein
MCLLLSETVLMSTRLRHTRTITSNVAELAVAAPAVVAHRLTRMALAGPVMSERDRREFSLMTQEKAAAFGLSWTAMASAAWKANQTLGFSFVRAAWAPWLGGRTPTAATLAAQWQTAALGVLSAGVKPVHRRATQNAKRLARIALR